MTNTKSKPWVAESGAPCPSDLAIARVRDPQLRAEIISCIKSMTDKNRILFENEVMHDLIRLLPKSEIGSKVRAWFHCCADGMIAYLGYPPYSPNKPSHVLH